MLGSVVRAAVGVPQQHLDLLAKLASNLSLKEPRSRSEGEVWHRYLSQVCAGKLPESAYLIGVNVTETEIGEFTVNYDETDESVLGGEAARTLINVGGHYRSKSRLDPGMFRPTPRTGNVLYKASALSFGAPLTRIVIAEWYRQHNKIMARSREGIDLALAVSPLKFGRALPLVMFGECLYDSFDFSHSPYFRENGKQIFLDLESFDEGQRPTLWGSGWNFLALQEVQPAA